MSTLSSKHTSLLIKKKMIISTTEKRQNILRIISCLENANLNIYYSVNISSLR